MGAVFNKKTAVRILSLFLCVLIAALSVSAARPGSSRANGRSTRIGSNTNVSVDGEAMVGGTFTAVVTGQAAGQKIVSYEWDFNGITADTESVLITEEIYDACVLKLTVKLENPSETISFTKTFRISNGLPVVYINTDDGRDVNSKTDYKDGTMKLELTDETAEYTNVFTSEYTAIEIRGRGNSTWGQPKKPYKLKLSQKADLFGMGSSKHWILLANAFDGSQLRNMLSYDLSAALGLNAINNIHVNLVFNGEYVGLYQLTENIRAEKGRVPVTNWESVAEDVAEAIGAKNGWDIDSEKTDNLSTRMKEDLEWITSGKFENYTISDYFNMDPYDTTGGYVIELDEYYDEVSKFITPEDVPIMIKSPEYLETNDEMFSYIEKYIVDMEEALFSHDGYNGTGKHYSDYLDVDSFIDYWIVNQAFKSVELLYKSCFMYKDAGGKIVFGPVWDMDWSSGNHANLGGVCADPTAWNHNQSQDREYWYRAVYHLPYFVVQLEDRWFEVRGKIQDMLDSIDSVEEKLAPAAADDNERWGGIWGWDFAREVRELKNWLNDRVQWMDEQLAKRDPNIMWMGIEETGNFKLTVSDLSGYTLPADGTSESNRRADLYYDGSGLVNVAVDVSENVTASVDVYVNGLKTGSYPVENSQAHFTVDTSGMNTAASGKRNVIHIMGRNANGSKTVTGEKYVSLYVTGTPVYRVSYEAGAEHVLGVTPPSAQYYEGDTFTVPAPTMTNEGYTFAGWSDGEGVVQPGDTVSVGKSVLCYTALWEAESGSSALWIILPVALFAAAAGTGILLVSKKKKQK